MLNTINTCQAVRNLFSKTAASAFNVLLMSTHDISWNYGPFGETVASYPFIFMGSVCSLESGPPHDDEMAAPLAHEPTISIDWNLPMTESAQCMLFKRILSHWNKTTSSFPTAMKKKYRMSAEEMQKVRNLMVLADQLLPHMQSRMSSEKAKEWESNVLFSTKQDGDLQCLLNHRPPRFAMSMLASQQEFAKRDHQEAEQKKVQDKEVQQAEVDAAQFKFFCGALKRDHSKMELVQAAPRLVRQRLHSKSVAHRAKLAAEGESACKGYQESS